MSRLPRALRQAVLDEVALSVLLLEHERIGPSVHSLDERTAAVNRIVRREKLLRPHERTGYRPSIARRTA